MGEMTSKYDGMTAEELAATLSEPMINALETGRDLYGRAPVAGRVGTIVALIDRGLVTTGMKHYWTKRGYEVAAHVLPGDVPTYPSLTDVDAHVPVAGVLGTSLGEMREVFRDEKRYSTSHLPRPLDVVQLPHGAIGVVERVDMGGTTLVRSNNGSGAPLEAYDVTDLRSVPPVAYEQAGVPGAIRAGSVPRDFATSELSQHAIMSAKRIAPDARLTLAAIKTDDRYEYGRAYVYAVASIIDATSRLGPFDAMRARREANIVTLRMLAEQLDVPLDELAGSSPVTEETYDELAERIVRRAQYVALRKALDVLEGWREGQRSNHDACDHRGEPAGEQCWEHWHSSDIRTMIADAARDLRVPDPNKGYAPTDLPAPS